MISSHANFNAINLVTFIRIFMRIIYIYFLFIIERKKKLTLLINIQMLTNMLN